MNWFQIENVEDQSESTFYSGLGACSEYDLIGLDQYLNGVDPITLHDWETNNGYREVY